VPSPGHRPGAHAGGALRPRAPLRGTPERCPTPGTAPGHMRGVPRVPPRGTCGGCPPAQGTAVRSRPDTTGSRASRPVDSDDVETRRNPRGSAQRAPLDRTNNLRVTRPTGREHTQRTLTDSATSEHPPAPLDRTNNLRVTRPTGREHTQRTLTDSATSEQPHLLNYEPHNEGVAHSESS